MPEPEGFHFTRRQSIALVILCTVFGAAAQIIIKHGAVQLTSASPLAMLMTPALVGGYSLYGISTVLLVLALRDGELSLLYPIISLTYVWVTLLSFYFFKETVNIYKLAGITVVVLGVSVIGRSDKR